ncbi:MAG: N-acetylmuramoyl-L-alanine amidase [Acidimicrobiia bacterium]|nr:N-acetylmuramoyl-L-alanine amidase [Acidimicrobiia bacterium]
MPGPATPPPYYPRVPPSRNSRGWAVLIAAAVAAAAVLATPLAAVAQDDAAPELPGEIPPEAFSEPAAEPGLDAEPLPEDPQTPTEPEAPPAQEPPPELPPALGLEPEPPPLAEPGNPQLRVVARALSDGRFEVAIQRFDGTRWQQLLRPERRIVPARPPNSPWLTSSPVWVHAGDEPYEVRVAARGASQGGVELGLQHRYNGGTWSTTLLPARRFVPDDAPPGRWLNSAPLGEALLGARDRRGGLPRALVTTEGIPVAVLGPGDEAGGYLVRTPCGNAAAVTGGTPIWEARVVIDPGHGGEFDSGAWGPNGLIEKDLNLTLSRAVLAELARRGIPAATTRTGDYGSPLSVRAAFADALEAEALISLHHNAPTHRLGAEPGTDVFIQSASDAAPRPESARLGGLLHEAVTAALVGFEGVRWSSLSYAGVRRVLLPEGGDAYGMVRRPAVPAVLLEYGYLSNPSEAELFATDEYIAVAAAATVDAIEAFLETDRPGSGFVEPPLVYDPHRAPSRCTEIPLE